MKKLGPGLLALATALSLSWGVARVQAAAPADTLAAVKKKGVLVCGVKDSLPPFGYVDGTTREIVGYDIDFCKALASKLGVKVELKPVTSASRMPQLQEGNVDLIAATMTHTAEREKQIDFSLTYFVTGQMFLTKTGTVKAVKDLEGKKIGTAKGSTSEQNATKAVPTASVLSFDDYPQAVLALQQGKVAAVTTDESILMGQLNKLPAGQFEIPRLQISEEPYGLGMRKGDSKFVAFVNKTLLEMEKNGEAVTIYDRWFSSTSGTPRPRNFKITAGK
jgi:polar amino acid transport system substrate-binding protein